VGSDVLSGFGDVYYLSAVVSPALIVNIDIVIFR